MALQAEKRYVGKVVEGSQLIQSGGGTVGFQVRLECEDGPADYVIWITPKNRDRALRDFEVLGVNGDSLRNKAFLTYELGNAITGTELQFGTKLEEWKGKTTVKVNWIGKKLAEGESELASSVAKLFGGEAEDDDIPF